MRSQTLQISLIVGLGTIVGLLILRPWRTSETVWPVPSNSMPAPAAAVAAPPVADRSAAASPPPSRTFNLPKVGSAPLVAAAKENPAKRRAPPPPAPLLVPKDWLVRGTGPESYSVRSDKADVFTGQMSVVIEALKKDIPLTQFVSLMQTAGAAQWVGKRVEFSVATKQRALQPTAEIWMRAIDASHVVIAYDELTVYPTRTGDWKNASVVIDVPWSATEIAYGVSFRGNGALHIDDAHVRALDKAVTVNMRNLPGKLGVVVQDASQEHARWMPSNLDFEDVGPADGSFREAPQDQLGKTRF